MMTKEKFTCGELYQLFGNSQKTALQLIFQELLLAISPLVYQEEAPSMELVQTDTCSQGLRMPPFRSELRLAKEELPKYLEKEQNLTKVLDIDAQLQAIQITRRILDDTCRWLFGKRLKLRWILRKLQNLKIDTADVFLFLEYRMQQQGISRKELQQMLTAYAESFS